MNPFSDVMMMMMMTAAVPNLSAYFCKEIAVSPNNNVVNIYEKKGKDWVKIHELSEHSGRITGTVSGAGDSHEL